MKRNLFVVVLVLGLVGFGCKGKGQSKDTGKKTSAQKVQAQHKQESNKKAEKKASKTEKKGTTNSHKEKAKAANSKSKLVFKEHQAIGKGGPRDFRAPCPNYKVIEKGGFDTPEGTIYLAYKAVLDNNFDDFYKCFSDYKKAWEVKRYYWKNVKKFINKYTYSKDNPAYAVCRKDKLGKDSVKIFVASKDPLKSHPPIILKLENGKWKITFFTP